ncbi:MAG: HlyD family efflux transporter periplasmic adaptor subunit [Gemmataceae bacterium]|nr:HlyD family efflux transporter periplasmic adaptor subunit [Gemmataceae bacterium]
MFRWIFLILVMGGVAFFFLNEYVPFKSQGNSLEIPKQGKVIEQPGNGENAKNGNGKSPEGPKTSPVSRPGINQPLVIPNARITAVERQDVPSEKEGKLLFMGTDVKPAREVPEKDKFAFRVGFLALELAEGEKVAPADEVKIPRLQGKKFRRWKEADPIEPGKVVLEFETKVFYKLEAGDDVKEGQLVGLVNPIMALDDLSIKSARLDASEADRRSLEKTRDEAHKRFQQQSLLRQKGAGSEEDYRAAELFWRRYIEEERGKAALVVQSQRELNASLNSLQMHDIRSSIPGVIKAIYKNRGEAVKNLEPVLQVQNRTRLRVEGLMEIQDARTIQRDSKVIVEPTQPEQPRLVLRGHLQDITSVCVFKGDSTLIISGSEDQTVRGWNPQTGEQLWTMACKTAVRSLGCGAGPNGYALAGKHDGSLLIFKPGNIKEAARDSLDRHKGSVNSISVSPDGETAISGGEDHAICVWKLSTGELISRFEGAHKAAITSICFSSPGHVVTAGKDNSIHWWAFENGKIGKLLSSIDKRSGDIARPGVSPNGKYVLVDQGKEIRFLSLEGRHIEGMIQDLTGSSSFSTFAVFSPDGRTILTNGGGDGKVQIWRTPLENKRPAELRQFIWGGGASTCGAFSPDGQFVVTGTQDHQILVWEVPSKEEVENMLIGTVRLIEPFLDSNTRQIRIWADLDNPGWIHPGSTATLVIPGAHVAGFRLP